MTAYLLDTTLLIDYANDRAGATGVLDSLFGSGADLLTCDVVTCEALSKGTAEQLTAIKGVLDALEYVAIDPEGAEWAAQSRRERSVGGNVRSLGDSMIAAVAWRLNATVVTRDPRDFERQGIPVLAY
jgi:predicted nucleic acid-binding protein